MPHHAACIESTARTLQSLAPTGQCPRSAAEQTRVRGGRSMHEKLYVVLQSRTLLCCARSKPRPPHLHLAQHYPRQTYEAIYI
jgi:hypothetical protein